MDSAFGSQVSGEAAAKQAEMVQFKLQMDGLKKRLSNDPGQKEQLRQACRDFEAVFIGKLWEQMEKTVPQEGYLHSKQEGMYKSMFNKEFSESMADAGGIGLADILYDQLAKKLAKASADTLAANTEIKPIAENGKADLRSLDEMREAVTTLRGAEPQTPSEIEPEAMGPSGDEAEAVGGYEMEKQAAESLGEALQSDSAAQKATNVSGMSRAQVEAELNRLAQSMRADKLAQGPGAVFDSARQGAFLSSDEGGNETGRILAEI